MKRIVLMLLLLLAISCGESKQTDIEALKKTIADSIENVNRQKFMADSMQKEIEVAKRQAIEEEREKIKQEEIVQQQAEAEKKVLKIDDLVGFWEVNMKCIQSSCSRAVVGDTKSEIWQFYLENGNIKVKVSNNDNTTPKYSGTFSNNTFRLSHQDKKNSVNVALQVVGKNKLSGTREILKDDPCKIVYKIALTR